MTVQNTGDVSKTAPQPMILSNVLDGLRHPHPDRIALAQSRGIVIAHRLGYIRQSEMARGVALLGPQLRGSIDAALVLKPHDDFHGFRLTATKDDTWTATVRTETHLFTETSIDAGAALMAALLMLRHTTDAPAAAA